MGNMYHNADIHRMYLSISFLFTCLSSLIIDIHFYPKGNQSWIFIDKTDAEAEAPILWPPDVKSQLLGKDPNAGKDLRSGGEGGDKGWDGWMASPTQWISAWTNCGRWWRTGKPGMLQSMGSQRVEHNWLTEQQHTLGRKI